MTFVRSQVLALAALWLTSSCGDTKVPPKPPQPIADGVVAVQEAEGSVGGVSMASVEAQIHALSSIVLTLAFTQVEGKDAQSTKARRIVEQVMLIYLDNPKLLHHGPLSLLPMWIRDHLTRDEMRGILRQLVEPIGRVSNNSLNFTIENKEGDVMYVLKLQDGPLADVWMRSQQRVPDTVSTRIVALGAETIDPLVALVFETDWQLENAPGGIRWPD